MSPTHLSSASSSNEDFIRKAATTVSTFSPGGVLLPTQAKKFVELAIVESTLLQRCNTQIVPTTSYEIDKIGYTGQVLLPDEEDAAFPTDDVSTPTTGKTTLLTKRYKAEISLTYDTVKRVIQGDNLMPYMLELLAKASKRDTEMAALLGDTSLAATSKQNRLLRKQDGFLKLITSNNVDAVGAKVNLDLLDTMRKQMPPEYYQQEGLEFILTKNGLIDFEAAVAARATILGDAAFRSQNDSKYRNIPVASTALMPSTSTKLFTYNNNTGYTNVVLANPGEQFMVGYLEEMSIRTAEDIRAGKFIAVLRFDVAFNVLHEPACVKAINVKES